MILPVEHYLKKPLHMLKTLLSQAETQYYYMCRHNKDTSECAERVKIIKKAIKIKSNGL